ncbi:hypothetical protein [Variovorax saccharolyticus]|uniref:hypothetical protein n=1 Tax=Variovorax saccharolyticus TaxID=3053516 RepID=UPI00257677FB|nr:hypothetical protein [Variovorax sp. J22R187]MDM0018377.1 hypothetical protein [Variovorax sp. J22R187]
MKKSAAKTSAEIGQGEPAKADQSAASTCEDRAARFRDHWGDEFFRAYFGRGAKVYDRKTRRLVPLDTYIPTDEPSEVRIDGLITEKKCRCCGSRLSLDCFSPSRTGRGGVKARCRECCAEAAQEYARTPKGKAARAAAVQKYEAQERARQETIAARARLDQILFGRKLAEMFAAGPAEDVKND